MRFILNFIFFGILFYLIWMFFPDAFGKLVAWTGQAVDFFKELFTNTWEKVQHHQPAQTPNPSTAWLALTWMFKGKI